MCNKMCDRSMLNVCVMSECDDVSVGGDAECVMWVCVGVYCCVRVCGYQLYDRIICSNVLVNKIGFLLILCWTLFERVLILPHITINVQLYAPGIHIYYIVYTILVRYSI